MSPCDGRLHVLMRDAQYDGEGTAYELLCRETRIGYVICGPGTAPAGMPQTHPHLPGEDTRLSL